MLNFSPIKNNFFRFNIIEVFMKTSMSRLRTKTHKIRNFIIVSDFISMVNFLFRRKIPSKMFLNDETVSQNIPSMVGIRMIFRIDHDISRFVNECSSFPVTRIFTRKMNKFFSFVPCLLPFVRFTHLFFSFFREFSARTRTMARTIFPYSVFYSRWRSLKFFSAVQTISNHIISKIKRLRSTRFEETVKFQRLLRALLLEIKKLFPQSNINITNYLYFVNQYQRRNNV